MTQVQKIKQPSTFDFFERFPDEDTARNYLINARWPNGVVCPHCGYDQVYRIRDGKLFRCKHKACSKQFTVRIGTVMEDSAVPLRKWLYAMFLFGIHSKGVASTKMAEMVGVTQKTAWFMEHRLRESFADDGIVLDGIVEADEVYIGGLEKNKHKSKRANSGRGGSGKTAVLGMIERGGDAVAFPVADTRKETLSGNVNARVAKGAVVHTDDFGGYNDIEVEHHTIKHSTGEYVRGEVHTNTIEGLWALVRRSQMGIYHYWSSKHLHRYINEIAKRCGISELPAFDDSNGSGITMVRIIMAGFTGRRLTYKKLING